MQIGNRHITNYGAFGITEVVMKASFAYLPETRWLQQIRALTCHEASYIVQQSSTDSLCGCVHCCRSCKMRKLHGDRIQKIRNPQICCCYLLLASPANTFAGGGCQECCCQSTSYITCQEKTMLSYWPRKAHPIPDNSQDPAHEEYMIFLMRKWKYIPVQAALLL